MSPTAAPERSDRPSRGVWARLGELLARPLAASMVLLVVYAGCSLLNDPRAFLHTDTGGKVATLRAMDARGDLDPDLGYWAEDQDPEGSVHAIAMTYRIGDRWVNVTTLPMIYAALPLYELGGLRGILLLPMLGAVLCALAARSRARRLARASPDRAGAVAFWTVGLATPVVVYALEFWEHTLGLAAMLGGVVLFLDVADGKAGWRSALLGGTCFGLAATMRTEAFVYAAVTFVVVGVSLLVARRGNIIRIAAGAAIGLVVPLALNQGLERLVLGQGLRAGRASSAAAEGGANLVTRVEDALRTSVGLNHYAPKVDWLLGGLVVILVGVAAAVLLEPTRRRLGAYVALGAAVALMLVRFSDGLGFVPGMLVASPLAVAGVIAATRDSQMRRVATIAIGALPLVWFFQYRGGANPQWGGRYVLASAVLLAIVGTVALLERGAKALAPVVIAAVLFTGCGVAWLSVRSHAIADAASVLEAREPILSSGLPHQLREWGAFYSPDRRWLTAETSGELPTALAVLDETGADRFTLVARLRAEAPKRLGAYERRSVRSISFLIDIRLTVAQYRRA
ncbi:MAG: hypothetical protein MUP97_11460 [Acidimicrobiia bacterium]|nr:hypothetical protein [Acidimicrobiia bacterium]